ncbi:HNH endonuclease [Catellatospora sichuanensis]|uniref:HNH endonuclease n=1 Tax=Catellatospora sichuanensis TaxID=1969805 RepID=UPI001181D765
MGQGNRCPRHRPKRDHALSATQRGYDYEYQQNRILLLRTNTLCWLCNRYGSDTADHIIPLSRGGSNKLSNLRPAHKSCNSRRGNRPR